MPFAEQTYLATCEIQVHTSERSLLTAIAAGLSQPTYANQCIHWSPGRIRFFGFLSRCRKALLRICPGQLWALNRGGAVCTVRAAGCQMALSPLPRRWSTYKYEPREAPSPIEGGARWRWSPRWQGWRGAAAEQRLGGGHARAGRAAPAGGAPRGCPGAAAVSRRVCCSCSTPVVQLQELCHYWEHVPCAMHTPPAPMLCAGPPLALPSSERTLAGVLKGVKNLRSSLCKTAIMAAAGEIKDDSGRR